MYYYAYGSNLDIKRMMLRCPSAEIIGVAVLNKYRLTFMENNGGKVVANILKTKKNDCVLGVVYYIPRQEDWDELDRCEGHPIVYKRVNVNVELESGEVKECITYIMEDEKFVTHNTKWLKGSLVAKRLIGIPKKDYLKHITNGYIQHELDINKLKDVLYRIVDELVGK